MWLQAIHPQNNLWLVPVENVCQFISITTFLILGAGGEFSSLDFGAVCLKNFIALYSAISKRRSLHMI